MKNFSIRDDMNNEIAERIKLIMAEEEIDSAKGFARSIGMSDVIGPLLRGRIHASLPTVVNICETYNISADWLIFGDGEMHW